MSEEFVESAEQEGAGVSRRNFMRAAAVVGAGVLAVQAVGRGEAHAAEDAKKEAKAATAAAAGGGAKKLADVLKVAREKMYPRCRVCPECDGVAWTERPISAGRGRPPRCGRFISPDG